MTENKSTSDNNKAAKAKADSAAAEQKARQSTAKAQAAVHDAVVSYAGSIPEGDARDTYLRALGLDADAIQSVNDGVAAKAKEADQG